MVKIIGESSQPILYWLHILVGIVTLPKGSIEKHNTCRVLALLREKFSARGICTTETVSQFSQIVTAFYFGSYENNF